MRVWGGRRPTGPWASCTVPLLELAVVSWEGKAERMAWKLARAMGGRRARHIATISTSTSTPLWQGHISVASQLCLCRPVASCSLHYTTQHERCMAMGYACVRESAGEVTGRTGTALQQCERTNWCGLDREDPAGLAPDLLLPWGSASTAPPQNSIHDFFSWGREFLSLMIELIIN